MKAKHFLLCLLMLCGTGQVMAHITLPRIIRDSMILQRDAPIRIWGNANAGEKISVQLAQQKQKTVADKNGHWQLELKPLPAGGPYTLQVKGSNTLVLKDILLGDVWLCSGQSNMEHEMWRHAERYAAEIAAANNPAIRQFLVPHQSNLVGPQADLNSGNWQAVNPQSVLNYSAVAYFFATTIYEKYKVPIGIINASYGGTPIEAWTSEQGLKSFDNILATIAKNKDTAWVNETNRKAGAINMAWQRRPATDKGLTGPVKWYDPAYERVGWQKINLPGFWEDQGIKDLDGTVWYSRDFFLPEAMNNQPARIVLGRIVDADEVYLNGKPVGNTGYQYPQRRYNVPAGILKAGLNRVVVRVQNFGGKGGFVPDKPYWLVVGKDSIDLKGEWWYRVGDVFSRDRPMAPSIALQNQPAALYNAMIAPVLPYTLNGVLWYQGESNAGNPRQYKKLMPALIADWRQQFQLPQLPVLMVQLPNFMDASYLPGESGWAGMREAVLQTLSVPQTGMAVTIDLGEWNDIHPDQKAPVGYRLALAAQKLVYGDKQVVLSPMPASVNIEGNKISIRFSEAGVGLQSSDGEPIRWVAIAGADKKFVWADAVISGDQLILSSPLVAQPKYVRYAWADNPANVNFYNKEGLPVSPFRTDLEE